MTPLGSPEDGTVVSAPVPTRLGPYRLIAPLGEGGMGLVHLALDPNGRAVAIKVLRSHVAADADARLRMEREFATLSRIRDPRVAAVIDADVFGDRPYLVTRFIPGTPLDELVRRSGPLSGSDLLRLGRGLAGALAAIHAVGVVHRDLKPANVLMDEGEPVVIDFGIAHMLDDSRITMTGLVMGTPGYLSPEVVQGAAVTEATDWWGFAATLAFAASGTPPFGRGPMAGVLDRVRRGEFDLSRVDPRLAPLLAAALAPEASRRPHHDEVVAALEHYALGGAATVGVTAVGDRRGYPSPGFGVAAAAAASGATGPVLTNPPTRPLPVPPTREWAGPAPVPPIREPAGPAPVPVQPIREWAGPEVWPPPAGPMAGPPGSTPTPWPDPDAEEGPELPAAPTPDSRAAREARTGTIVAAAVLLVGLGATWPGLMVVFVVLWRWLAGAADHALTAHLLRRAELGPRGSHVPVAVAKSPWHGLVGALGAAGSLLVSGVVGAGTVFTVAFAGESLVGRAVPPSSSVPLAVGTLALLLTLWWGPGGQRMSRGTRSLVRGLVPSGAVADVVAAGLVVAGVLLGVWVYLGRASVSWWPLRALATAVGLG